VKPDVLVAQLYSYAQVTVPLARLVGARTITNLYGHEIWSPMSRRRRRCVRATDRVIADSHSSLAEARRRGLIPGAASVIRDCVDTDRFKPGGADQRVLEKYGLARKSRFRILFLGRTFAYTRYKGTERLVRLVSELGPDSYEAVFAGQGDDQGHLGRLAAANGVRHAVMFAGPVAEADLVDIYRSADLFYLVSERGLHRGEGLPLAPLEAMSCGVPVIVGDQDGSREVVDGPGGLRTDPYDFGAQMAYVRALSESPAYWQAESRSARERAVHFFGVERFFSETWRTISQLNRPAQRLI